MWYLRHIFVEINFIHVGVKGDKIMHEAAITVYELIYDGKSTVISYLKIKHWKNENYTRDLHREA